MKVKEKRIVKGYKITNSAYLKAMRRAKKDDFPLASLIEEWVIDYGKNGFTINNKDQTNSALNYPNPYTHPK